MLERGRRGRVRAVSAGLVAGGAALCLWSAAASATATLTASPDSGLTNGQSVTLTGSGFAPSSTGNILECNDATGQPTVALGAPVNSAVSVGCSAPALAAQALASTSATGTLTKTYPVTQGKVGPPCGATGDLVTTCPSTDSAGHSPASDAAAYPCPPTAAQQAAGVTCSLHFGDQAGDTAQATILFQGESAPTSTTPASTAPPTTAPPATAATTATASTTQPATPVSPGSLAYTGPGAGLQRTAQLAMALVCLGLVLWVGPTSWRRARREEPPAG